MQKINQKLKEQKPKKLPSVNNSSGVFPGSLNLQDLNSNENSMSKFQDNDKSKISFILQQQMNPQIDMQNHVQFADYLKVDNIYA